MPYSKKSHHMKKSYVPKKFSTVAKKAVRKAKKAVFSRAVKRVVQKQEEVKIAVDNWSNALQCLQNGTTSLGGNWRVLNPSNSSSGYTIARGSAEGQMIGNKIRMKSCHVSGTLTPTVYNGTTNPFLGPLIVRAYFYKQKGQTQTDVSGAAATYCGNSGTFFQNGSGYRGFLGTLVDLNGRIQTDDFTYLGHKTYKLGQSIPINGGTSTSPNYNVANNDFKLFYNFNWNVTKYLNKVAQLDTSGNWSNPFVIVLFQVLPATAAFTIAANTVLTVQVQAQTQFRYVDA